MVLVAAATSTPNRLNLPHWHLFGPERRDGKWRGPGDTDKPRLLPVNPTRFPQAEWLLTPVQVGYYRSCGELSVLRGSYGRQVCRAYRDGHYIMRVGTPLFWYRKACRI